MSSCLEHQSPHPTVWGKEERNNQEKLQPLHALQLPHYKVQLKDVPAMLSGNEIQSGK